MKYQFQSASNINDYLKAIGTDEEFIVKTDEVNGFTVINYMYVTPTTFPDPMGLDGEAHRLAILRRDCRGIKFDINSGDVITKPYAKFFNCLEKPETQIGVIDWSQPHRVLEKLDGSLVTAHKRPEGWQWHTKMGATDVARPIAEAVGDAYRPFCEAMREEGLTGIFEWCSRKQRIVIDYPEDRLVLTGIRHNVTGEYVPYPAMVEMAARFGIPVVRALEGSAENIQEFLDTTALLEDAEGYVIRFDTGHMCKVKALLYCRIHGTKDALNREKNVWALVLNDSVDDAKQFMDDKDKAAIDAFVNEFELRVRARARAIATIVARAKAISDEKKRFALEIAPTLHRLEVSLAFKMWDGHDPVEVVKNFLLGHISSQNKIDAMRGFLGHLRWYDYYYPTELA